MMVRYHAFLLRIWHSEDGAREQWSFRVQHLPDGQLARLGSLDELKAYLHAVLRSNGQAEVELSGNGQPGNGQPGNVIRAVDAPPTGGSSSLDNNIAD